MRLLGLLLACLCVIGASAGPPSAPAGFAHPLAPTWPDARWRSAPHWQARWAPAQVQLAAELARCPAAAQATPLHRADAHAPTADEQRWLTSVGARVAQTRGLPLEQRLEIQIQPPQTLRDRACAAAQSATAQSASADAEPPRVTLQRLLGLIAPDLTAPQLDFLRWSHVQGAYQSTGGQSGAIWLVFERPLPLRALRVYSHEVVHALQDQFQRGRRFQAQLRVGANSDAQAAYDWVREGDAANAALSANDPALRRDVLRTDWGQPADAPVISLSDAAPLEAALIYAAYRQGAAAVAQVRDQAGWSGVNSLLIDVPDSTEQLLHPGKLRNDEQPLPLDDPPALAALDGWRLVGSDRLGEFALRALLELSTGQQRLAAEAAAGWGGDRVSVYRRGNDGEALLLWRIAFDDAAEHRQGVAGLREWLIAHSGGRALPDADGRSLHWRGRSATVRLIDTGDSVWLVASKDSAAAESVSGQLLTAARS